MSNWKSCYETHRKYKLRWERQFAWLEKMNDGSENAFCKLCCKILQPKLWTLICHSKSNDHITQEEFCHLEVNGPPPCKLKKYEDPPLDTVNDSDVIYDDAEEFGVYVMDSLVNINSDKNRENLKRLIRDAVATITKLDRSEGRPSKIETISNEETNSQEPTKRKVVTMKLYKP